VTLKWVPSTAHPEDLAVFFQSVGTVTSIELQSNSDWRLRFSARCEADEAQRLLDGSRAAELGRKLEAIAAKRKAQGKHPKRKGNPTTDAPNPSVALEPTASGSAQAPPKKKKKKAKNPFFSDTREWL